MRELEVDPLTQALWPPEPGFESGLRGPGRTFGVAGQGDDFHAVAQGCGNGFQVVGRAQEHDLGQVKGHVQIAVSYTHLTLPTIA